MVIDKATQNIKLEDGRSLCYAEYGDSQGKPVFQPKRRLIDWPDDVTALADHLKIGKFAVFGWSFGGPYVMAYVYQIPERLTVAGLISSFAPHDRPGSTADMARFTKISLTLARWMPWVVARQLMKM